MIENEVIEATDAQVPGVQAPKGAVMSVTSKSGVLLELFVADPDLVLMSAIEPASHTLTYTWLLSVEAVANMRKRVVPGAYTAGATQDGIGGTAYCVNVYGGDVNKDNDGAEGSRVCVGGFTAKLEALKTVTIGTMHGDPPRLGSLHEFWLW